MKVVVIGSGMSGLTAAACLARDDCAVDVYEQADHIGGVTATLEQDGYQWDIGPMLIEGIGPGEPAGLILDELGCSDRIELIRGDRGLYFPDFRISRPDEYSGPDWRREELKAIFPDEAASIDRFYKFLETSIDLITLERHSAVSQGLRSLTLRASMALLLPRLKKYTSWTARQLMDEFFTDRKLRAFFLAILADMTIKSDEYPALGIPFSNQENAYDRRIPQKRALGIGPGNITFQYIKGGCGRLVAAMEGVIRENGGALHTGSTVRRIVIENDRARGIELADGERQDADLVMVSGGARECFFKLIGRESIPSEYAAKVDDIPLMESILMVHLGVDMDPTPHQDVPLNYYYGENVYHLDETVDDLRAGAFTGGKGGFLIYVLSLHSPEMAPPGKHAITVYTIAPNKLEGGWEQNAGQLADGLLANAERIIPGLREHTQTMMVLTPKEFGQLVHLNDHHSFGGYCPMMGRSGAPHRTPFRGLWFLGSQSESGPGVWTQIISSRSVFRMARREL